LKLIFVQVFIIPSPETFALYSGKSLWWLLCNIEPLLVQVCTITYSCEMIYMNRRTQNGEPGCKCNPFCDRLKHCQWCW
jgi:hypothetical protein